MALKDTPVVFVVDDDEGIRASIKGLLKSAGLRAECFETAEEFLQKKASSGPSCLILDVSLPGINGLDFQQQLRAAGLQIPIIFLTAHGSIPMTVKAMKNCYLRFSRRWLTLPARQFKSSEAGLLFRSGIGSSSKTCSSFLKCKATKTTRLKSNSNPTHPRVFPLERNAARR